MTMGLIIVGDEILSGRRADAHLSKCIDLLSARGLELAWAQYVGDEPARITAMLVRSLATSDMVFCTGGIGATPDDHTRQCAAAALGVPLCLHPEAQALITERVLEHARRDGRVVDMDAPEHRQRLRMGEFPQGARIIPNPYNRIPGFSVADHHFVPGFPVMAWPMMAWVLDTHYAHLQHQSNKTEASMLVFGAAEALLTPLMEQIEASFAGIRVFSLPSVGDAQRGAQFSRHHIELGVKGCRELVESAYSRLRAGVAAYNFEIVDLPRPT